MPERRNLRVDGVAWSLLFCGLVVALCALSHEPGTASDQNLLGIPAPGWRANSLPRSAVRFMCSSSPGSSSSSCC